MSDQVILVTEGFNFHRSRLFYPCHGFTQRTKDDLIVFVCHVPVHGQVTLELSLRLGQLIELLLDSGLHGFLLHFHPLDLLVDLLMVLHDLPSLTKNEGLHFLNLHQNWVFDDVAFFFAAGEHNDLELLWNADEG